MNLGNSGIGPYAEERENISTVAMIFINPEIGAEGLLKSTATKVGLRSLVNLTEETFSQALYNGVENVGGSLYMEQKDWWEVRLIEMFSY